LLESWSMKSKGLGLAGMVDVMASLLEEPDMKSVAEGKELFGGNLSC